MTPLRPALLAGSVVAAVLLLGGCTGGAAPGAAAPVEPEPPAPPPPPAACLLDADVLGTATGLEWSVDEPSAGDTRCLYDPAGGREFLAVEIAPLPDAAATALDDVAALCDDGTRAPLGTEGFSCTFRAGTGVFLARAADERLTTVSSAGIPAGTTAAALTAAVAAQLG